VCDADGVATQVYDLLAAPGSPPLPVRHDAQRGFFVPGLAVVPLPSLPHALHMVQVRAHLQTHHTEPCPFSSITQQHGPEPLA
jgi:hypothetical protein